MSPQNVYIWSSKVLMQRVQANELSAGNNIFFNPISNTMKNLVLEGETGEICSPKPIFWLRYWSAIYFAKPRLLYYTAKRTKLLIRAGLTTARETILFGPRALTEILTPTVNQDLSSCYSSPIFSRKQDN